MAMLVLGVLLFACVHFVPSLAQGAKARLIGKIGEDGYKGIFSVLLLGSFALIIFGWRSTVPIHIYTPPSALHQPALFLLALAFWLMAVSQRASRLRLLIRHPQLAGVAVWGISHLLLNGDSRGIVLFGGFATWALCEMWSINRREGSWIKDETPAWSSEGVSLLIAATAIAVVVYIHPWISGVPVR